MADRHNDEVATALAVAQANEAKAAETLAQNARDTQEVQDQLGNMARDVYQQGGVSGLSIALEANSPEDFTNRLVMMDTVMRVRGATLRGLDTMRAEGKAVKAHLVAVRQQVAALKVQAEAALAQAKAARETAAAVATAVVVGTVPAPFGLLASTHRTDGRHPNTLIASVRGGRWFDEGRAVLHMADPVGMGDILLRTVDVSKESIDGALSLAGLQPADVDVFAMHQGMPWLRQLVQDQSGLSRARAVDTFGATAHLFGAFVPSTLFAAERDGILNSGDLVVIAGGGNGMTYGAAVMRSTSFSPAYRIPKATPAAGSNGSSPPASRVLRATVDASPAPSS